MRVSKSEYCGIASAKNEVNKSSVLREILPVFFRRIFQQNGLTMRVVADELSWFLTGFQGSFRSYS